MERHVRPRRTRFPASRILSVLVLLFLATLAAAQTSPPPTTLDVPTTPPLISRPPKSGICPPGQEVISIANITVCSVCAASTYNINGDGVCRTCPEEGVVCVDGSPRSQRGWWIYEDILSGVATPYRCPDGFCDKNSTCTAHRTGVLCGACEIGYTQFYLAGGPCSKCTSVNWLLMIGIFLALWVVVIAITIGESIDNTAKAKIVIFFVQTLPMVLGPQFRTSDWLELVNLSGGSSSVLSCLAPWDFYQQFLFNILLPYGLFIFLPINYGLQYLIVRFIIERKWPEPPQDRHLIKDEIRRFIGRPRFNLYVRAGFALLLFNYSTVATAVFSFRGCRRVGGATVLASAPEIDCNDQQYKTWNVFALIMLIYVIVMPLAILGFLIWAYKTMKLFRTRYLETAGVLYDAYKMRAFWWEPITLCRRVLIASIYTGLFNSADWRTFAMFLVVTGGFVVHILFYPYRQRVENFVEAYLLLLLQVISALMASSAVYLFGVHKRILLGLIIAFSIVAIIILALWNFMLSGAQTLADKWGNENFKKWVDWTEKKLKEKKVNQPRSLSKFYSWQEKRDANWANTISPETPMTVAGDEDRPYYTPPSVSSTPNV